MAQQTINNGDAGLDARTKINTNFLELYTGKVGTATAQTNVTWTVNSLGLSLNASGYAGTGTALNLTNLTGTLSANSAGISLSMSAGAGGASPAASAANGSFTFQTVSFSNLNGISFGTSAGSAITASHNGLTTARASNDAVGLNTAQTNVTWTVNSAGISFNASGYAGTGTTFNGANISASITQNSNGIQLSASVAAPGGGMTLSGLNPYADQVKVAGQVGNATINIDPMRCGNVVFDRIINNVNFTATSNSSGSITASFWNGLYTRNVDTLSLLSSFSTSTNASMSGTVGSYSLFSGIRNISIPASMTLTQGDYWLAVVSRTTTGGAAGMTLSQQLASNINSVFAGQFGVAHNTTMQLTLGQGIYSVTSAGLPNSIGFNQIRGSDSGARRPPFIMFAYSTV